MFKFAVQSRAVLIRVGVLTALILGVVGIGRPMAVAASKQDTAIQV